MSSSEGWYYEGKGKRRMEGCWRSNSVEQPITKRALLIHNVRKLNNCKTPKVIMIHLEVVLNKGQGYGVMFRVQNYDGSPNGYAFQYDPGLEGIVFRKWVNGWEIWQPLAYQKLTNYQWYGVSKDIDVVVKGNSMQAYIDGELVISAKDDTYSSGG